MTPPADDPALRSPSLHGEQDPEVPAFELKFLLDEPAAGQVQAWSAARLSLDRNGDAALGGAYSTTTLYLDTPELDVYHRSPTYRRRKYRVRRYGLTSWVYLERKAKSGDRVAKRRIAVPNGDLQMLTRPLSLENWSGHWFHRRILDKRLAPACLVAYRRTAFVGDCPEGPLRLTIDRELRGIPASDWSLAPFEGGLPLAVGRCIVELKFLRALPLPFKSLMADLRLTPGPISKYRLCRDAWGVGSSDREAARA